MQTDIFPVPRSYRRSRSRLNKNGREFIRLHEPHGENLLVNLDHFATRWQLQLSYGAIAKEQTLVTLRLKPGFAPEGYGISTTDAGYLITATEECGLFRGLCSLEQVLASGELPYLTIKDAPDFSQRGVMLDISRCKVPTLATLKTLIDQFAALKFNQLQLYTEHTFAFSQHKTVWAEASPLTAADILELKHYAAARYIDLVPNLNCFGHFERWLCHPDYHRYAESPEGFVHPLSGETMASGSTLYPGRQSLQLLNELHGEYLPLFDSEYFNVGGDEPWELGLGRSQARCEQEGTTNVYIDFLSDIQRLAEQRGRRMMFWSDIVLKEPASLKRLSKQLIALNWGYEGNHPFANESKLVAKQNIPFYVCPGTSSWNSLVGRTDNMRKNIQSAAKEGKRHGAEGLLVTDWGDHGHHQYLPISYPGFALAACESWHQGSIKTAMLSELVNRFFLKEPQNDSAAQLIEHGRVLNLARSPLRNATIFNRLLFWQMRREPSATQKLDDNQLFACLDAFADLENGPQAADPLVAAELDNAREMASHGIQRLLYFRGSRGFNGAKGLKHLRQQIRMIQGEHARIWLERNRIGGLRESSSHLERSEQALLRTK